MRPVDAGADPRQMFGKVPFTAGMGMRREFSEGGRARLVLDARPDLGNVIGAVHGGAVMTLLDVTMASAAVSLHDFQRTAITLHFDASFIEPGRVRLIADGEVVRAEGDIAHCRATVRDAEDRLVALAQGSFRYVPLPRLPQDSPQDPQETLP